VGRWLKALAATVLVAFELGLVWGICTVGYAKFWPEQPGHLHGYDAAGKSHALGTAIFLWLCLVAIQAAIVIAVRERRVPTRH
jgi:hypothetical protein